MPTASLSPEPGLRTRLPVTPFAAAAREPAPPLLPEFREGDACFASPTSTLHARGLLAALPACTRDALPGRATELLERCARDRRFVSLIGAIAFGFGAAMAWRRSGVRAPSSPPKKIVKPRSRKTWVFFGLSQQ